MAITVKKLIEELSQIKYKHLEVEVYVMQGQTGYCEIGTLGLPSAQRKKVLIFTRNVKNED